MASRALCRTRRYASSEQLVITAAILPTTHHSLLTQMRRTELTKLCAITDGLFRNGQWLHIYPEVYISIEYIST